MNWDISTPEGMQNAKAWQVKHLSLIKDKGSWIVPRSGTVYKIDHEIKTATRTASLMPEPDINKVFRAMGWTLKEMK